MTHLTMPDLAAARGGGTPRGTRRDGAEPETAARAMAARSGLLAGAVAVRMAADGLAAGLIEAALADPEAAWWPFDLARLHQLYGERLRRSRQVTLSRHHFRAALTTFELLGEPAWAARAAAELAATAPTRRRRETGHQYPLTAQELQVAELAAAGLSNKEIGARLNMSHRTVSSHLYRIFPKLGISSRAALRDALSGPEVQRAASVAGGAANVRFVAAGPAAASPRGTGSAPASRRPAAACPRAARPRSWPRRTSAGGAGRTAPPGRRAGRA
jgi:DNA-binding CsgD family transcriptional regulator